jgi:hypothetical protein
MSPALGEMRVVDDLMERASRALLATDYFEAEHLCLAALEKAFQCNDFERMSRIVMPLQESRRQRRQQAADTGRVFVVSKTLPRASEIQSGMYLVEPPLIGRQAKTLREMAERRRVPVIVIAREPLTRLGKWPIVAVGDGPRMPTSIRTYVDPPKMPPTAEWFLRTNELLGDAAILKVKSGPAAWRADELMHFLDAHPDHEKLHQALEAECRKAMGQPLPARARPGPMDDPSSF